MAMKFMCVYMNVYVQCLEFCASKPYTSAKKSTEREVKKLNPFFFPTISQIFHARMPNSNPSNCEKRMAFFTASRSFCVRFRYENWLVEKLAIYIYVVVIVLWKKLFFRQIWIMALRLQSNVAAKALLSIHLVCILLRTHWRVFELHFSLYELNNRWCHSLA